jgi:hypothetical protein
MEVEILFFCDWDFCGGKKKIATDSPTRAVAMLWRGARPDLDFET